MVLVGGGRWHGVSVNHAGESEKTYWFDYFLWTEHDINLVLSVCHRVHVLEAGRWITSGAPDEIRSDPAVIDACPRRDARRPAPVLVAVDLVLTLRDC